MSQSICQQLHVSYKQSNSLQRICTCIEFSKENFLKSFVKFDHVKERYSTLLSLVHNGGKGIFLGKQNAALDILEYLPLTIKPNTFLLKYLPQTNSEKKYSKWGLVAIVSFFVHCGIFFIVFSFTNWLVVQIQK